jgi:energy-coupling factor transport system permease protein
MPSFDMLGFFYWKIIISGEKMNSYKKLHVITALILNIVLLIITFSSDDVKTLLMVMGTVVLIFYTSFSIQLMLKGLKIFLPFSLVTLIINTFFVTQGGRVLFTFGSRSITFEAITYAALLSIKLLLVVYIFQCLALMIDSDRAVSFFSSVLPKSTLIFMIAMKLFPLMKRRTESLREIYSIRGVDFDEKTVKAKVMAYLPVLSVLLEDSLEKSFDIGEAVYVRGFLSSKRSVYERQKLNRYDFMMLLNSILILIIFFLFSIESFSEAFSIGSHLIILVLFTALYAQLIYIWKRLVMK